MSTLSLAWIAVALIVAGTSILAVAWTGRRGRKRSGLPSLGLAPHVNLAQHVALVGAASGVLVLPSVVSGGFPLSFALVCFVGIGTLLLQMLQNLPILAFFAAVAVGSLIFPPLAIVGVVIAIWLVLRRIQYFLDHLAVIVGGGAYYAAALASDLVWPTLLARGHEQLAPIVGAQLASLTLIGGAGALVAIGLHLLLRDAYRVGYTPWAIFSIAVTAPAVVLLLVLAIVGVAADFVPDVAPDFAPDIAPDAPDPAPDYVPVARGYPDHPPLVQVDSYVRSDPDGFGSHVVRGHVRTAPDGILENNLSYDGPHAPAEPPPHGHPPPAVRGGPGPASVAASGSASAALRERAKTRNLRRQ